MSFVNIGQIVSHFAEKFELPKKAASGIIEEVAALAERVSGRGRVLIGDQVTGSEDFAYFREPSSYNLSNPNQSS